MGFGSSSSSQTNLLNKNKPATKLLGNQFMGLMNQWTGAGGTANPLSTAGTGEISKELSSQYLDPSSNPYLAKEGNIITSTAGEQFGRNLAAVNGAANNAGALLSAKNAVAQGNVERSSNQDVTNALTQLYGQNYQNERAVQTAAAPKAIAQGNESMTLAMQIASLLAGSGMGSSGSMNVSF